MRSGPTVGGQYGFTAAELWLLLAGSAWPATSRPCQLIISYPPGHPSRSSFATFTVITTAAFAPRTATP